MLQEKVRLFIERELLAAPNEREHVLIPCLQSLAKPCLGFLPVSRSRGFEAPGAIAVPVPHPPETTAPVQGRRDAFSVVPFTTSCLNEARKAARSDRKNRIFRPITRRWGICRRSTQAYTVCGLTPRNRAASCTVNGNSSADT